MSTRRAQFIYRVYKSRRSNKSFKKKTNLGLISYFLVLPQVNWYPLKIHNRGQKRVPIRILLLLDSSKNTWAWKGKLKRFFVNPKAVEMEKNGTDIIWRYSKNKYFLFYAQGCGSKFEPATLLCSLKYKCL